MTDASSHATIPSIGVTVYNSSGDVVGGAATRGDGSYTAPGLAAGSYRVEFGAFSSGPYAPQYYNNKATLANADPVTVTAGATTPAINADMQPGGRISGTVTDASSHAPLAGVQVTIFDSTGRAASFAQTANNGTYTSPSLGTGSYKVGFVQSAAGTSTYAPQYYNNKATLASADFVAVTAGATTPTINAGLQPGSGQTGGVITGTVTAASSHAPAANVEVTVYDSAGGFAGFAQTATDGTYSVSSLGTGSYKVQFARALSVGPGGNYLPQYYNNEATLASADAVPVTEGATTAAINAALQPGGRVSGTVTDASSHAPIAKLQVTVYDSAGGFAGFARTASDGTYSVTSLGTGSYNVEFASKGMGSGNYARQYYNNKPTLAGADPVAVTAGATTSGINAAMQPGGQISGTVTDASSHAPIAGITVRVSDPAIPRTIGSARTASDGTYTVSSLGTGSFTVQFAPGRSPMYLTQYYNNKPTRAGADPVAVTAGATTSGINAAMQPGGQITGTVTDASSHAPIAGIEVGVYDAVSADEVDRGFTASDGTYKTSHTVPAGSYKVAFLPSTAGGNYAFQYYNNQATWASASLVAVTSGAATAGINAAMRPFVNSPPAYHLSVTTAGSGSGVVTGSGISCPAQCSASFPSGTVVTLAAAPASGSTFGGWSGGGCSGPGACVVTMSTDQAVTATFSAVTTVAPASTGAPSIVGSPAVGVTLGCSNGFWSGSTPQTYAYQWQRDGTAIAGATGANYTITTADGGHALSCRVTASNIAGSASATSASVSVPAKTSKDGVASVGHASVKGTTASVPVSCKGLTGRSCTVTLKLTLRETLKHGKVIAVSASKRTVTVGTTTVTLSAGQTKKVQIKLNHAGGTLLAGRHKLSAKLQASQATSRGNTNIGTQMITFKTTGKTPKRG